MNRIDRLRHIRKSALTQDETRTAMRQAKMNIWNQLKYPVTLQILEADEVFIVEGGADNEGVDENDWETVFVAQDVANLEFRLSAYHMPSFFTRMRLVDADGTTYEQSHADVADFNEAFNKKAKADLEPLNAFVKSAPERAAEIADELITAALRSQHFTISPRSQVLLTHPNLHHLVFHEFEDCVVCRIHTTDAPADDTEPIVTISKPEVGSVVNSQRLDAGFSFASYEIDQGIQAFLILLCASIVRDFWVLEERARQQVYQKRTEKRMKREGKGKARKMVVSKDYTFIPRFSYDLSVYQTTKMVQHQARVTLSPHLVSGHIRRLPKGHQASEEAKENAQEFGIKFNEGETFVRPHERGEIEQLRNYRSRSAMQLLFRGE